MCDAAKLGCMPSAPPRHSLAASPLQISGNIQLVMKRSDRPTLQPPDIVCVTVSACLFTAVRGAMYCSHTFGPDVSNNPHHFFGSLFRPLHLGIHPKPGPEAASEQSEISTVSAAARKLRAGGRFDSIVEGTWEQRKKTKYLLRSTHKSSRNECKLTFIQSPVRTWMTSF